MKQNEIEMYKRLIYQMLEKINDVSILKKIYTLIKVFVE